MSELLDCLSNAGAEFVPFGDTGSSLVETFGAYEAEYAAIRKGVGILHEPQRGLLRFTGKDRQDFLHRMTTQDIRGMTGGQSRRAFQLNAKGRIIADLIVHHGDEDTWLDGDDCDLPPLAKLYDERLFGEDVTIEHITATRTCLGLYGPQAEMLLEQGRGARGEGQGADAESARPSALGPYRLAPITSSSWPARKSRRTGTTSAAFPACGCG